MRRLPIDSASFLMGVVAGFFGGAAALFLSRTDYWALRHKEMGFTRDALERLQQELESLKKERDILRQVDEREEQEIKRLEEMNRHEEDELMRLATIEDKQRKEIDDLREEVNRLREEIRTLLQKAR